MTQTKKVDVFNHTKRQIKCISNEHDYIGDGQLVYEKDLEVGKLYTMVKGELFKMA